MRGINLQTSLELQGRNAVAIQEISGDGGNHAQIQYVNANEEPKSELPDQAGPQKDAATKQIVKEMCKLNLAS